MTSSDVVNTDVTLTSSQSHLRLIDMEKLSRKDLTKEPLVARSIVTCHHCLESVYLLLVHCQAEEILEHFFHHGTAYTVSHMLVHSPTHQTMKVLGQSPITLGDEFLSALETPMDRCPAFDDFSLDPT